MLKYVRWCNCVEVLASGKCFNVSLRTRRYSLKKTSNNSCFLGVNFTVLSKIHFLKTSPTLDRLKKLKSLSPIPPPGGLLGGFQ